MPFVERPLVLTLGAQLPTNSSHFFSSTCTLGSYTILVKDEFIFLASHIFHAQMLVACSSIEELIAKMVEDPEIVSKHSMVEGCCVSLE